MFNTETAVQENVTVSDMPMMNLNQTVWRDLFLAFE
jgi:hypothetical protein